MLILLQFICALLIAVGSLFILIDLRAHFDRSFRFFGLSLILLCAMTAIDLWVTPGMTNPERLLYWQCLYHVLACLFMPFSLWYLLILTDSPYQKYLPAAVFLSFALAILFLSGRMLDANKHSYSGTFLYNLLFVPFVLAYAVLSNLAIALKLRKAGKSERRILILHLVGFLVLCACGVLDMAEVSVAFSSGVASFTILGVLGYGTMASLIFAERFVMLLSEKDRTLKLLKSAYQDLEQVNTLRQLGESTAIINHEIKNYLFMISGNAQLLQEAEKLSDRGLRIVENIITAIRRMSEFSDDILTLSRTRILREKHPVNLSELITGTVEKHFPGKRRAFHLQNLGQPHFVFGDWGKLEQVFVNLFKNSFEAAHPSDLEIRVKIATSRGVLLVIVEDNGPGCGQDQLELMFQAFYSTKLRQGGTGLGMSIARTIVEGHGGKISAYSKNLARANQTGLKLILSFPVYEKNLEEATGRKYPIVLIKEGMENIGDIIRVFQNVGVSPFVVTNASELNDVDHPPESMIAIATAPSLASRFPVLFRYKRLCLVSRHSRNLFILDHGRSRRPEPFSEEYVLSWLMAGSGPTSKTRIRERQHQMAD